MNVRITDAQPEDAFGITDVLYKAWLATYPNQKLGITVEDIEESYKEHFTPENILRSQERLRNIPANQKRVVAKDGDLIVGAAALVINENNNQLRTIYVLPEYHGKGIGTALWNAVKDFSDPGKDTIVQLADYNEQAIKFYEKMGFVDTGKRFFDDAFVFKSGARMPEMEMVMKSIHSGLAQDEKVQPRRT
ncbi:MAG TPA: GNAT family N-acetyltransferase [Candidatus Paceibacterota bacterium]